MSISTSHEFGGLLEDWATLNGEFIARCASLETLMDEAAWQAASILRDDVLEFSKKPPMSFQSKLEFVIKLVRSNSIETPKLHLCNIEFLDELDATARRVVEIRNAVAHAQVTDVCATSITLDRYRIAEIDKKKTASYEQTIIGVSEQTQLLEKLLDFMVFMELVIQALGWKAKGWNELEIGRRPNIFVRNLRDIHSLQMLNSGHVRLSDGSWKFDPQ